MLNQSRVIIHQHLFQILKEKYHKHTGLADRISAYLVTDNDMQEFANLLSDVMEVSYERAIDDCRKQFEKLGYAVAISHSKL